MSVFDTAASIQWASSTAFRGADMNRLYSDRWIQTNKPDTEIRYSARPLRAAARDLVRNNPYASGAVESVADNIVGKKGILPVPKFLLPSGEPDRDAIREVRRGWDEWGDECATVDGIESWFEVERLIAKNWFTDGEVFIRHHRGWDNPYGYATELIDPDLLDEEFNESRDRTGREIVMGVEVDEFGRPLAYHFWKHHPDDIGRRRERVRVPASEITHHFVRYRAGQTRGFSCFAPVLTTVEMIDGYQEAELVAARYHASKMGFIETLEPEAVAIWATRMANQNQSGRESQNRRIKLSPGQVEHLAPGQRFTSFDPNHPNDAFDPFLKALMRGVARGVHMSSLTYTGDVSDANYSSMRAGLLPERDHWEILQDVTARRVHRPVYRAQLGMGMLTGGYRLRSSVARDYYGVEWRGRRWKWVDPKNDLDALEGEIKLGINSRQRAASERGLDYETVVDESAEDVRYAKDKGVYVGGANAKPAPARRSSDQPVNSNGNGNGSGQPASRLVPYGA